jgi:hypothetical protein
VKVKIMEVKSLGQDKRLVARFSADSDLARKRMETGILASNVKP